MGYTNYWNLEKTTFEEDFLNDVKKLLDNTDIELANGFGEPNTKPIIESNLIALNGLQPNDYEGFVLNENTGFNFCKTARLPYDAVVKAILMIAEGYGIVSNFHFDGYRDEQEYLDARKLLKTANINIKQPPKEDIRNNAIIEILEDNCFSVMKYDNYWIISNDTPHGQDWQLEFYDLKDIVDYAENFDPEEEFKLWYGANRGEPCVPHLWHDCEFKQRLLDKVAYKIKQLEE